MIQKRITMQKRRKNSSDQEMRFRNAITNSIPLPNNPSKAYDLGIAIGSRDGIILAKKFFVGNKINKIIQTYEQLKQYPINRPEDAFEMGRIKGIIEIYEISQFLSSAQLEKYSMELIEDTYKDVLIELEKETMRKDIKRRNLLPIIDD